MGPCQQEIALTKLNCKVDRRYLSNFLTPSLVFISTAKYKKYTRYAASYLYFMLFVENTDAFLYTFLHLMVIMLRLREKRHSEFRFEAMTPIRFRIAILIGRNFEAHFASKHFLAMLALASRKGCFSDFTVLATAAERLLYCGCTSVVIA